MGNPAWKQDLINGYRAYRTGSFARDKHLYEELAKGQSPKVMVIACSDSRVDPGDIFAAHPGEIFIVRNVANIVPPSGTVMGCNSVGAALEYAVTVLAVEAIIIIGHESCGGVAAFSKGAGSTSSGSFLDHWLMHLNTGTMKRMRETHGKITDFQTLEYAGVLQSIENLVQFPFIAEAVETGRLALQGAYFRISTGELEFADESGNFHPLSET